MVLVATQVKRRRGTTAENDAFTGAEGEITVDTEKHELRVHDGATQGGHVIPTNETLDFANKALDNLSQAGEARFTNKANSDLSNTPSNIDYVVEEQQPTGANAIWYRKYKSGWVEQGGIITAPAIGTSFNVTNITLPIAMGSNYHACDNGGQIYNGGYGASQQTLPYSSTMIQIVRYNMAESIVRWRVEGQGA